MSRVMHFSNILNGTIKNEIQKETVKKIQWPRQAAAVWFQNKGEDYKYASSEWAWIEKDRHA